MPGAEASWVPQDQELGVCANTQPEEQSPSCCQMDQLWEKGRVELLSSGHQQCPGSGCLQAWCFISLPSIRFCVSLVICVPISCLQEQEQHQKAQSRLLGKMSFAHCPFPCSRILFP